jgi:opacity protein-like surface antigen
MVQLLLPHVLSEEQKMVHLHRLTLNFLTYTTTASLICTSLFATIQVQAAMAPDAERRINVPRVEQKRARGNFRKINSADDRVLTTDSSSDEGLSEAAGEASPDTTSESAKTDTAPPTLEDPFAYSSSSSGNTGRYDHTKLGIDFHGGLTFAKLGGSGTDGRNISNTVGFELGAGYDYEFHPNFAVHPEFNFVQKGFSIVENGIESTINTYYIEIPVLFKAAKDVDSGKARINGVLGPAIAFNLGNSFEAKTSNGTPIRVNSVDTDMNSVDFGLLFGAGVEVPVETRYAISADLRYDLGLATMGHSSTGDLKNRALLLLVGFKF